MNNRIPKTGSTGTQEKLYYFYTESLGLVENTADAFKVKIPKAPIFETPDEAKCDFYKRRSAEIKEDIDKATWSLSAHKITKRDLDALFGHLKEEYPEEFL